MLKSNKFNYFIKMFKKEYFLRRSSNFNHFATKPIYVKTYIDKKKLI